MHNRDLLAKFINLFNRHDADEAAALIGSEVVNHSSAPDARDRAGLLGSWDKLWTAFPDLSFTCEDVVAERDRVVCRVRMRGTNAGPLRFSRVPLPATGRVIDGEAIYILRFAGDRVVELWTQRDELGMLRQLGHLGLGVAHS